MVREREKELVTERGRRLGEAVVGENGGNSEDGNGNEEVAE